MALWCIRKCVKIALPYGAFRSADGDILMAGNVRKRQIKGGASEVKDDFLFSSAAQGPPEELSAEIYRQIESFAGYSFCKAHSASYAVESYQSLYLKVHYPVEFMVAVINNQGGFYRTEVYVHEAKMSGGIIHTPCVNKSEYETTLYGVWYWAFAFKSLQAKFLADISSVKIKGDINPWRVHNLTLGIDVIHTLIFIVLLVNCKPKPALFTRLIWEFKQENRTLMLLQEPVKDYKLPELERSPFEDAFDEIELLSFPVSCSPFDLLQTRFRGDVMAKELLKHHKKQVKMLAYLISRKHVPTKMGDVFWDVDDARASVRTRIFPTSGKVLFWRSAISFKRRSRFHSLQ